MAKSAKFMEKVVGVKESDIYILAMEICDTCQDNFVMYENEDVISIGMGRAVSIQVSPEWIKTEHGKMESVRNYKDLSGALHDTFKNLPVEGWRAYGIARFGLACYNHNLPLGKESDQLMEFFIPEIEIRLFRDFPARAVLRSAAEDGIGKAQRLVDTAIEKQGGGTPVKAVKVNHASLIEQNADAYKTSVAEGVNDIHSNLYQKIILSRKVALDEKLDMGQSFLKGRSRNTPARSYRLRLDDFEVLGYSPETVAEVDRNGIVTTFPLAGTRARLEDASANMELKNELLRDPKEIAEHAVSVKLAFEELEQVCEKNSVKVIDFMSVLERGTVQHLASKLKGKLKEGYNEWHGFNTLFPAVTASGIPKRESIEGILRHENAPRDLYSGSVITYDYDGTLDAALVLRSAYQTNHETWLRAGAGIVKLSSPDRELEETREKLSCVSQNLIVNELR